MPVFSDRHYVPILKGKGGEFTALGDLAPDVREALTPLVEIVSVPWDYDEETERKTIEEHLAAGVRALEKGWGGDAEFFLDSVWIDPAEQAGGVHHLEHLFDLARESLQPVPVGGLSRGPSHTSAVATIAAEDERGACLRLEPSDIEDEAGLPSAVDGWLAATGLAPSDVDLVLDLGEITDSSARLTLMATRGAIPTLPHLADWRTFTVASGGFPEGLADVDTDSEVLLDRLDWGLWQALRSGQLDRQPGFGDYAINHPSLLDANPRHMRPPASIRYTAGERWLIVKRQWIRRGHQQFQAASSILINRS